MLAVFLSSSLLSTVLFGILHEQARLRQSYPGVATEVSLVIVFAALGFAALTATGVACWWFVVSRRFSGPVLVMEGWLNELRAGHIPVLRPLRRSDEFKELYVAFSKAIERLKAEKQAELDEFTSALQTVRSTADADEQALRDALNMVETHLEKWRNEAAHFLRTQPEQIETTVKRKKRAPADVMA
jgi:nitrogen fixation/metabolism regulation signal transduction histidine kinase